MTERAVPVAGLLRGERSAHEPRTRRGPYVGSAGLFSMAWRNLWRSRRRTALTLASIAFGTMLAVLFTGIGDSNFGAMIDLAARMGGGHVTLQHPEFLETPTFSRTVSDAPRLRALALSDPEVERVTLRISGGMMLATAAQNYGAAFVAFDPTLEDEQTLSLLSAVSAGEVFASSDAPGIVLGARLAQKLDADVGRKVVYTLTDKNGEIVQQAARVVGLIETGAPTVDGGLALVALDRMRELLGYAPDETLQIAVFLRDQRAAGDLAARLGAAVGPERAALAWYENQPELAGFIQMKVASANFLESIILLLVAAGIFNTIFVSVMERMREFGIMLAIGFSPARLFSLVMCESLWLGVVGIGCAAVLTAGPYWYLHNVGIDISKQLELSGSEVAGVAVSTVMRASIYGDHLVVIILAALAATLLSGLYPAWSAGRVAPVESIRLV
jgi:ABC-type lipoprotein release transport system permease subunit